jgi:hypothetical protein
MNSEDSSESEREFFSKLYSVAQATLVPLSEKNILGYQDILNRYWVNKRYDREGLIKYAEGLMEAVSYVGSTQTMVRTKSVRQYIQMHVKQATLRKKKKVQLMSANGRKISFNWKEVELGTIGDDVIMNSPYYERPNISLSPKDVRLIFQAFQYNDEPIFTTIQQLLNEGLPSIRSSIQDQYYHIYDKNTIFPRDSLQKSFEVISHSRLYISLRKMFKGKSILFDFSPCITSQNAYCLEAMSSEIRRLEKTDHNFTDVVNPYISVIFENSFMTPDKRLLTVRDSNNLNSQTLVSFLLNTFSTEFQTRLHNGNIVGRVFEQNPFPHWKESKKWVTIKEKKMWVFVKGCSPHRDRCIVLIGLYAHQPRLKEVSGFSYLKKTHAYMTNLYSNAFYYSLRRIYKSLSPAVKDQYYNFFQSNFEKLYSLILKNTSMEIYQSPIYLNPTRGDGISQSSEVNRKYIKPSDYLQARLLLKDKPLTAHDIKASRVNLQTVEDLVIRGDVVILPQAGELTYYYPPKKRKITIRTPHLTLTRKDTGIENSIVVSSDGKLISGDVTIPITELKVLASVDTSKVVSYQQYVESIGAYLVPELVLEDSHVVVKKKRKKIRYNRGTTKRFFDFKHKKQTKFARKEYFNSSMTKKESKWRQKDVFLPSNRNTEVPHRKTQSREWRPKV